jgi:hypothetical protein
MHQTWTSHHRQHRGQPTIPRQQFSLDAYTHTRASYRNHVYCDLLTDLATGRIYPIYTKDRSASELVTKVSIFFALHPSWQNQYDNVDRFIRLDPERNYRSEAFLRPLDIGSSVHLSETSMQTVSLNALLASSQSRPT